MNDSMVAMSEQAFSDGGAPEDSAARQERAALQRRAAENAVRVRAAARAADVLNTGLWIDTAVRMTGLTRDELLAKVESLPEPSRENVSTPRERARRRMVAAGVPELHIQNVVDSVPIPCDAFRAVEGFMRVPKPHILILSGGLGTRKTGSACWVLSQGSGIFVEAADLLAISIEDKARWLRLRQAQLVVLDDLGTEIQDAKGYWLKAFNTLMNGWYASCAKVIITCNLDAEKFKVDYGQRVPDRIRERGRWLDIQGESVRGR